MVENSDGELNELRAGVPRGRVTVNLDNFQRTNA